MTDATKWAELRKLAEAVGGQMSDARFRIIGTDEIHVYIDALHPSAVLALLDENEALREDLRCSLQRNSQLDEECERLAERLNAGEALRAKVTARTLDLQKRLAKAYIDRLPEDYDAED